MSDTYHPYYTEQDKKFIKTRFEAGDSDEKIAKALGRTEQGIQAQRLKQKLYKERVPRAPVPVDFVMSETYDENDLDWCLERLDRENSRLKLSRRKKGRKW